MFNGLNQQEKTAFQNYELLAYICEGTEIEIKNWFQTINIQGVPLNQQELLNAVYSGPFVTAAREYFSNHLQPEMQKWLTYIKGDPKRQDILATALSWVSDHQVETYLSQHRDDQQIDELKNYFNAVIDWVSTTFLQTDSVMRQVNWGDLYRQYHQQPYDLVKLNQTVAKLFADPDVTKKAGIYEYVLGEQQEIQLVHIRTFSLTDRKTCYQQQTTQAKA